MCMLKIYYDSRVYTVILRLIFVGTYFETSIGILILKITCQLIVTRKLRKLRDQVAIPPLRHRGHDNVNWMPFMYNYRKINPRFNIDYNREVQAGSNVKGYLPRSALTNEKERDNI